MRLSHLLMLLVPASLRAAHAGVTGVSASAESGFAAVDSLLAAEVASGKTPSVQYMHFGREGIRHVFRKGEADLSSRRPVDSLTSYHASSLTKTFTAVALFQLVEDGKVSLDDAVRKILPDAPVSPRMSVRHLLSHTSGLPNPLPMKWIHGPEDHSRFDRDGFFGPLLGKYGPRADEPGSVFRYSNLGYVLLGRIIEAIAGMRYEDFLERRILSRLGTGPGDPGFAIARKGSHAVGYHARYSFSMLALGFLIDKPRYMGEPVGGWRPFREHYVNGAPYGGLIGTPGAFAEFGRALLEDGRLLSRASRDRMFGETVLADGKRTGMALGWFRGSMEGKPYVAHAGGGGGYYCELRLYPDLGQGSFIVFNRSGFSDARFLDRVDCLLQR